MPKTTQAHNNTGDVSYRTKQKTKHTKRIRKTTQDKHETTQAQNNRGDLSHRTKQKTKHTKRIGKTTQMTQNRHVMYPRLRCVILCLVFFFNVQTAFDLNRPS